MKEIVFVFPGQGSQTVGMGKAFFDSFQVVKEIFQLASDTLGYDVAKVCFDGPKEELDKTAVTQPCILTVSYAMFKCLESEGISPSIVAGHSLGEYSALTCAKSIDFTSALKITTIRGSLMQSAVPMGVGAMAAVLGLDRQKVESICASVSGYVAPANYNCPGQIVISGEKDAVTEVSKKAVAEGALRVVPLAVSVPSHSLMMKEMSEEFEKHLKDVEIKVPSFDFVNNADAMYVKDVDDIRDSLVRQLYCPVLWEDTIRLISERSNTFIEVGPGKVLSGLIKRIVKDCRIFNLEDPKGIKQLVDSISS
ncbi:MAG: ACP S-malonyltransferase [Thermodesulfovibrionales bacterium]|nr:ACP S-malonyltransferase [Thermodesulfovibrionales bacterium]